MSLMVFSVVILLDALDSMNNKQAIQHADKILKKQKDLHCAKVKHDISLNLVLQLATDLILCRALVMIKLATIVRPSLVKFLPLNSHSCTSLPQHNLSNYIHLSTVTGAVRAVVTARLTLEKIIIEGVKLFLAYARKFSKLKTNSH